MKKITDERLKLQSLKNIRFAYVVQTIGIVAILVTEGIRQGAESITESPLLIVFLLSNVLLTLLSLPISLQTNDTKPESKGRVFLVSVAIGVGVVLFSAALGAEWMTALIVGVLFCICHLIISLVVNRLTKGYQEE